MVVFLLSSQLINDGVGRFHNAWNKNDQIELSRHSIRSTSNTEPGVVDCTSVMPFSVESTRHLDVLRCWNSSMPIRGLGTRLLFLKLFVFRSNALSYFVASGEARRSSWSFQYTRT